MDITVKSRKYRLTPKDEVGKGGEADIYDLHNGEVAKIFKPSTHPDYAGADEQARRNREGAELRLREQQKKLRVFPSGLPSRVIAPCELVMGPDGKSVVGYTMPFITGAEVLRRYAERSFRTKGLDNRVITEIFRDLHGTVSSVHKHQIVIGDFNDLNVLVRGTESYLIDADSFQFKDFVCRSFTERFVDPILCDAKQSTLLLAQPHTEYSDWYAFAIMLMECLLYVDPYGGVYRPKNPKKRVAHAERPLHRITVFHPEVVYPKPAIPYAVLPDELLQYFHRAFEKDERGVFPRMILDGLRWTRCVQCGMEHARALCPMCAHAAPAAIRSVTTVRGTVTATRVFRTRGVIMAAVHHNGKLRWVWHENEAYHREKDRVVMKGSLEPNLVVRISGDDTVFGEGGTVVTVRHDGRTEQLAVDTVRHRPIIETNEHGRFWVQNGQLMRDGSVGPEYVGDVLESQTRVWMGPTFGFGFYRAGELFVAFVFDGDRRGLNDSVKVPPMRGQLVDATATFSSDHCWFLSATQEAGRTINRCTVIRRDGVVAAVAEAVAGDGSWLSTLHGKCAAANFLLAATDDGMVRLDMDRGAIVKTREFPDTEPFVDASSRLIAGDGGVYVVSRQEITLLKIN